MFIGWSSMIGNGDGTWFSVDELKRGSRETAVTDEARRERSPGMKLLFAGLVGFALMVPLMMVYWLVWDRQEQSNTAQATINAGWGGPQVVAGPLVVVPYRTNEQQTEIVDGRSVTRSVEV
jgi:inner membrane protein